MEELQTIESILMGKSDLYIQKCFSCFQWVLDLVIQFSQEIRLEWKDLEILSVRPQTVSSFFFHGFLCMWSFCLIDHM